MVEPKVVLAVPVLDKIPTPCFNGLASLVHAQMFSGYAVVEGTLLPFARNKLLQIVYEKNPDFTHVLFVDCDMCNFTPNHVVRLWQQDKDIISGLFTMRKAPYSVIGNFEYNTQGDVVEKYLKTQAVVETDRVGMAFTLIKKPVLDAIKENIGDGKDIWFTMDREERDGLELEIKDFIKEHKDNPPELLIKLLEMP